jgi:predicted O-methyltransferase YrrM
MAHLKHAFQALINRRLRIRDESRRLSQLARLPIAAAALQSITREKLADLLDCPETHREWARVEPGLTAACPIEDLMTDGVNPGDRRALWYLVKGLGARSVLEVGTNVGASTFYIAAALKSLDGEPDARLVTIDIEDVNNENTGEWKKRALTSSPEDMIRAIDSQHIVTFVNDSSLHYLDSCAQHFDLVFLDGDHSATTVYQEISHAVRVLNKDGVILLHDYFPKNRPLWKEDPPRVGPYLGLSRARNENPQIGVLPLHELPWPTKPGTRKTTLALVTRC